MRFCLIGLSLFFSISSFAGDINSAPKDLVFQDSISTKIKVTLPYINISNYKWHCTEYHGGKYHQCSVIGPKEVHKIKIGNCNYSATVEIWPKENIWSHDLTLETITWENFTSKSIEGQFLYLKVTLSEVETGASFDLLLNNLNSNISNYPGSGYDFPVKILSNY